MKILKRGGGGGGGKPLFIQFKKKREWREKNEKGKSLWQCLVLVSED